MILPKQIPVTLFSVAILLCFAAAFGCALFFTGGRGLFYAPAALLLLAGGLLCALPSFWRGTQLPCAAPALLLLGLWLYITISLTWSAVPFTSMVTWIVFTCLPLTFFSLLIPQNKGNLPTMAAGLLLLALTVLAAWAVIQFLVLQDTYGQRAYYPLPHPDALAALLDLGLLPALALALNEKKPAAALPAIILFAGLMATQSVSGFFCFVIAGIVLAILLRPSAKSALTVFFPFALLFVFMLMVSSFGINLIHLSDNQGELSRLPIWKAALDLARDYFWQGTGFGTFYLYYPAVRAPLTDDSVGQWAYMDPLQLWAETGITTPVLLYLLSASIFLRTRSALKKMTHGTQEHAMLAGLSCALLTIFLQAHVNFVFYIMAILIVCGVWLAAWYDLSAPGSGQASVRPLILAGWQKPFMALCVLCLAAPVALLTLSSAAGQYYMTRAQSAIRQGQISLFFDNIEQVKKFAPPSFIDADVALAGFYIGLLEAPDPLFSREEQGRMLSDTLDLLRQAETMNPAWAEIDHKRAALYNVIKLDLAPDARNKVIEYSNSALRKNPGHTRARMDMASALMKQGRADAAYATLEQGLLWPIDREAEDSFRAMMLQIKPLATVQKNYRENKQP